MLETRLAWAQAIPDLAPSGIMEEMRELGARPEHLGRLQGERRYADALGPFRLIRLIAGRVEHPSPPTATAKCPIHIPGGEGNFTHHRFAPT